MNLVRSRPTLALRLGVVGCFTAVALASSGCGSSDSAPVSEEEAKSSRVYRLSHDRIDDAIKNKEAKKSTGRGRR